MNNISFTGIKNMGAIATVAVSTNQMYTNEGRCLLVNLTDDYNGNDLTRFKDIIKKCHPESGTYANEQNGSFIRILSSRIRNLYDDSEGFLPEIEVNGKTVPLNDENLPLFSFIAEITRRVCNMPKSKFVVNNDFISSDDAKKLIYPGVNAIDMAKGMGVSLEEFLNGVYNPQTAKISAQQINDDIQEVMMNYLA